MEIVMLHGMGQNAASWKPVIDIMPKSFVAKCPDLFDILGEAVISYPNMYRAFTDYCNAIPYPLNLCGLSLGGILALDYTIQNPEKVRSLVLIGTQAKMPKLMLKIQNIVFKAMPASFFKKQGEDKSEFLKTMIPLTKSMQNIDFRSKLCEISCPALIVCGSKDIPNKKASGILANAISGAQLEIMENGGHALNTEMPSELADALAKFYATYSEGREKP